MSHSRGPVSALLAPCALLAACSVARPAPQPSHPADLDGVRAQLWRGEVDAALDRLDELAWERVGSVSGERMRQDLRLARGARGAVLRELAALERAHPGHPDVAYLRTRIVEDPERRLRLLEEHVRRWPQHAWMRLGAVGTAQSLGRWSRARAHLHAAPRWRDAEDFRTVLAARQAEHDAGAAAAFRLLHEPALRRGLQSALVAYLRIAERSGDRARVERARAEIALRSAWRRSSSAGERIDAAFTRLAAEWPWLRRQDLDAVLRELDRWARIAGAPAGWARQPRFRVAGLAEMAMPEPQRGPVARAWADAGRFLLAGQAWSRGTELHLLRGLHLAEVAWPGAASPVLVVLAEEARSPSASTPQGGAVFHGFFVRLDQVGAAAARVRAELDRYQASEPPPAHWLAQAGPLESWDLPQRLRALRAREPDGRGLERVELRQVLLHESAHLLDVLPWVEEGPPVMQLLPAVLRSSLRFGDPLMWLEYRAQLRALAAGVETRWVLAEVVERAQQPRDDYYRPYRALLEDLVALGRARGWPHLARWDTRRPEEIAALAAGLLEERGLEPLPEAGWSAVAAAVEALHVFEQAPADGTAAHQVDGGEVHPQ